MFSEEICNHYEMDEVRLRDRKGTRERILQAAGELFAELGYKQVTMRLIATEARVNITLINRYFGAKRELFAQVLAQQDHLSGMIEAEDGELPRRLAQYIVDRLSEDIGNSVIDALSGSPPSSEIHGVVRDRVMTAILGPLEARLSGEDARLRAAIATVLIMSTGTLRQFLGHNALHESDREIAVELLTGVFATCLGA
jgi:AcrR family transcriptional regulator